jgi:hypothetical protein
VTRTAVVLALAALALPSSALAAPAGAAPAAAPGVLSIGQGDDALVQLERGSVAPAGGTLLSPTLRIWRLPAGTAQRVLPGLLAHGDVVAAERDRAVVPLRVAADPFSGFEWWRAAIGADRAAPPGPGRAVTVLDTGVDATHPEFAGRPNTTLLGPQSITDSPDDYHGTAVSSVVGAPENGVGIVGVYPQSVLRSADVVGLTVGSVIAALDAAIRAGPSVVNMSFGIPPSRLFENLVTAAFGMGSILVAASGNERAQGSPVASPANLPHVLTIGATDRLDRPTSFSTASIGVDLAAPGVDIPGAVPLSFDPEGYAFLDGTSFAAPLVAGATAWVWTRRPQLDPTQIFDLMRYSARDVAEEGFDPDTGYGVLDIPSALSMAAPPSDPLEPNDDILQVRANGIFRAAARPLTTAARGTASLRARLDVTEDPVDVYRLYVPPGRTVRATVTPLNTDVGAALWKTSATTVYARGAARARTLYASSSRRGRVVERVAVRNRTRRAFFAYLDVFLPEGGPLDGEYRVSVATVRP